MLQDTLWMVKYIANKLTKSKSEDVEEIVDYMASEKNEKPPSNSNKDE